MFKITYIFNSVDSGWSESWYIDVTTHDQAMATAMAVAPFRAKLLGSCAQLEAIRVSDPEIFGDAKLREFAVAALPPQDDVADNPGNTILCRVEAGPLYRRAMYLRGCPDSWIRQGLQVGCALEISDEAIAALSAFKDQILGGPVFQLAIHTKDGTGAVGTEITAIGPGVDDETAIITSPGFTGKRGEKVLMKQWRGPDSRILNRSRRILAIDGNDFTIDFDYALLTKPHKDVGGIALSRHPGYAPVTDVIPERPVIKSTGRAFFVQAGRRKRSPK